MHGGKWAFRSRQIKEPLVSCISGSLPKARGHYVCWQGVPTKSINTSADGISSDQQLQKSNERKNCSFEKVL